MFISSDLFYAFRWRWRLRLRSDWTHVVACLKLENGDSNIYITGNSKRAKLVNWKINPIQRWFVGNTLYRWIGQSVCLVTRRAKFTLELYNRMIKRINVSKFFLLRDYKALEQLAEESFHLICFKSKWHIISSRTGTKLWKRQLTLNWLKNIKP